MLAGVGTGSQLAIDGGLGEHRGIGHERIDGIDTGIEVVLDDVEVAVVAVGDLGRDGSLGDLVDIAGGHVQGSDHGVERVIHAGNDLLEVTLVLAGVGTGGQLAVDGSLAEHVGISSHGLYCVLN